MNVPQYLRTPAVPLARAWNTWTADRFLEFSFKPMGVRITPVFYAASAGRSAILGPGSDICLGVHTSDASHVEARFTHHGTTLDWSYAKTSPFDVVGAWNT